MMKTTVSALAAALALAMVSGSAMAQTTAAPAKTAPATTAPAKAAPAPTTTAPATTAPAKAAPTTAAPVKADPAKAARSELSLKCSAEATAKNLHGKERKKFRKACMKKKPS